MRMVSEVEAKNRVILVSPQMAFGMVMKRKKTTGRCPRVMLSTESAGLMMVSIFMSRELPSRTRELIKKA